MSDPRVESNVGAGIYVFQYMEERIAVRVDRITEDKKSLWGEITVKGSFPPEPGWHHIFHEGLNLLAGRTRKQIAGVLTKQVNHVDWDMILEQVCLGVIQRHREGEPVVQVKDIPAPESIKWRLEPIMVEGVPTLIYGFGGTGKSYLGAYFSCLVAEGYPVGQIMPEPGPVLYLDYENSESDNARRFDALHAGLDLGNRSLVHYRRCSQRLATEAQEIQKIVLERSIEMVVVDTAGPACGGDPESAQSAIQFFMALRSLNVTSLVLAHKSKMSGASGPFGSVYWTNYPRNVFHIKASQSQEEDVTHVGLFHEKANDGRLMRPMGFRLEFLNDGAKVSVAREDVKDIPEFEESLSLTDRIKVAIRQNQFNPMSIQEIAEYLQAKPDTVTKALRRNSELFASLPGNRWGLMIHSREGT